MNMLKRSALLLILALALVLPGAWGETALAVTTPSDITTGSDLPPAPALPPEEETAPLVITGQNMMRGGAQQTLTVTQDGKTLSAQALEWAVYPADASVASIKNGKLTTKKVTYVHYVQVTAALKSDSTCYTSFLVTIVPGVKKVSVTASNTYIDLEGTKQLQLSAVCEPEDAMQAVTWSSSNKKIATVDENGLVTALKTGKVTLTATAADGSKVKGKITLQIVRGVSGLTIEGADTLTGGRSMTLKAVTTPENASIKSVTWSVDCDKSVATISTTGKLTAKKVTEPQRVVVTATSVQNPQVQATHVVTICPATTSLKISAPQTFIDLKEPTLQLTATSTPAGSAGKVTWTSSSTRIATVDANGLVTAKKVGKVTITAKATDGSGKTAKITLQVVNAVETLTIQGAKCVGRGCSITLKATVSPTTATNQQVVWSVNCDKSVATIDQKGRLTAGSGVTEPVSVVVTAKSAENDKIQAQMTVQITEPVSSIQISAPQSIAVIDLDSEAKQLQLSATVLPENASQTIQWKSSNDKVATVDANGLVTAKKAGTITITATATDGSGVRGSYKIRVCKAVRSITISGVTKLGGGQSASLSASVQPKEAENRRVVWSVNCDKSVASISSKGYLTTKAVETVTSITVTATSAENKNISASWTVTIYPKATSVKLNGATSWLDVGGSMQLSGTVAPDTALKKLRWTSSNSRVATVDENGLVKGIKAGTVTITCRTTDGSNRSASVRLTVGIPATQVTITGNLVLKAGKSQQLRATVEPTNATVKRVRWSISCGSEVATVRNGLVKAAANVESQVVTVTAQVEDGSQATATFRIFIQGKDPVQSDSSAEGL